ncbi:MAG: TonB-dependent receptor [Bacteroidota bacterium]
MRPYTAFIVLATILGSPILSAQEDETGSIAGRVLLTTGEPAAGAAVLVEGTSLGDAADEEGRFLITGIPGGEHMLRVRLVGYRQEEPLAVSVSAGRRSEAVITMAQEAVELGEMVVTGTRRQDARDVRPSLTTLAPREAKILPGAAEDILRSLQALPGVTSVSDISSQLVVRGSGPDQNLILIDGFEVLNPYRLYGFVSMFNPETATEISLQTGGFAAPYGDRLSAVLDVRTREGRTETSAAGKINLSLTNMNLVFEGALPLLPPGSSYLVSARRTYYDLILGPLLSSAGIVKGEVALPNFRDFQAKAAVPLNPEHRVSFSAFTSRDGAELASGAERNTPDSVNVFDRSFNTLAGIAWAFTPSPRTAAQTHVSWYRNSGSGVFDGSFVDPSQNTGELGRLDTAGLRFFRFGLDYDYVFEKTSLTHRWIHTLRSHTLEAGGGVDLLRTDFIRSFEVDDLFRNFLLSRGQVVPVDAVETVRSRRAHLYVQDRIAAGERLFIQPGLRLDHYGALRTRTYLAPRLNLSYRLDDVSSLRAAYGRYYQSPGMEKQDFRIRLSFNRATLASVDAERADHWILGYDRMLDFRWQFKAETYYKRFANVLVPARYVGSAWRTPSAGGPPRDPASWGTPNRVRADSLSSTPVHEATGKSYGFELLIQKIRSTSGDRLGGWVSYALSWSERERDGLRTPFLFDQRHAVNVVGNYRFAERWEAGVRFTLRSGRPYPLALGVAPRVAPDSSGGGARGRVLVDGAGRVILDPVYEQDRTSGRLGLYHSLDVRITTSPRWWGLDWSVYLDIQNVTNHANPQQLSSYVDEAGSLRERPINGIPIFPSIGMSLSF